MKKIIAIAFVVTLMLSAAIIYTRPSGQIVSQNGEEMKRSFEEIGRVRIEPGEIVSMEIMYDIEKSI